MDRKILLWGNTKAACIIASLTLLKLCCCSCAHQKIVTFTSSVTVGTAHLLGLCILFGKKVQFQMQKVPTQYRCCNFSSLCWAAGTNLNFSNSMVQFPQFWDLDFWTSAASRFSIDFSWHTFLWLCFEWLTQKGMHYCTELCNWRWK